MMNRKAMTPQEVQKKLEYFCAYQERCHQEVDKKLTAFLQSYRQKQEIKSALMEGGFLDEGRFAIAFAGGKFRQKKWGKKKIVQQLKIRKISETNIRMALKTI